MQTSEKAMEIDFAPAEIVSEKTASLPVPEPVAPPPALAPEAATIFSIIERAARDPSVDIDKMERLIAMQERMHSQRAKLEYDNAMSDAQQEMQPIRADQYNKQTQSKYASYHALDDALRPVYTKHGFSLSFGTSEGAPDNCVRICCTIAHRGGHREERQLDMPADGKGAKGGDVMTRTHATGAAITYGKRYLLSMIFNIAVSFEDDDGNGASPPVEPRKWGSSQSVDPADRELTERAPKYTAGQLTRIKSWLKGAHGTLKLTGHTAESLGVFRREHATKFEWVETNMPEESQALEKAYHDALDAAQARM